MILGSSKPVTCALHRHSAPYRGTFRRGNSSVHVSVKPERRTRELAFTVASLSPKDEGGEQRTESMYFDNVPSKSGRVGKGVNLFDPAATASRFITRRFGLVGGLTFVALLASVEGGEILKALLERDVEGSDEVVKLPSGLSYVDTRIGGGAKPKRGDFVGVHLKIVNADTREVILDTRAKGRPVAFIFMKKPLLPPLCVGLEEAVSTMGRGGVRNVLVPAELGFGAGGCGSS